MTALALTYEELRALNPCSDSLKRITKLMGGEFRGGRKITAAMAREAGATFGDIVWVASAVARYDKDVERRMRLWMADCAARVLHIYERTGTSTAPRNAIVAARAFARGEIDDAARDAAWAAAGAAAGAAAWAADAARAAARAAARDAARDAAWYAAWAAARAAAWAADWDAARAAEEAWQFDRLVARLSPSDPEPADWPLPDRQSVAA